MEIGQLLKIKREQMNMSARSLSLKIGKSPAYVSKIESGEIHLSFESFCQLVKELNLNTVEVLYLVANGA